MLQIHLNKITVPSKTKFSWFYVAWFQILSWVSTAFFFVFVCVFGFPAFGGFKFAYCYRLQLFRFHLCASSVSFHAGSERLLDDLCEVKTIFVVVVRFHFSFFTLTDAYTNLTYLFSGKSHMVEIKQLVLAMYWLLLSCMYWIFYSDLKV